MLNLYRYQNADSEDVTVASFDATKFVADKEQTKVLADGMWLAPTDNNPDLWAAILSNANTDPKARLARMVFMEAGRSDSFATGKMTTIRGEGVRGYTDQFIAAPGSLVVGDLLSLHLVTAAEADANEALTAGTMVLTKAAAGDVVKAIVVKPNTAEQAYLYFEIRDLD